ncbi:hypothetical protein N9Y81_01040 [Akkermansiaceae bacterium]|nr:hypothetical protein [Akkermansiaceae bacterium]
MKHLLYFFALVLPSIAADFYVSTDGNDKGSGKIDDPFATLERARDAVRKLKTQIDKGITVQIRGGEYRPSETIIFGPVDSGKNSNITYEAIPGETPIFSSDLDLGGWEKLETPPPFLPKAAHGKVWVTDH